jgi:Holliday junction resolvase
MRRATRIDANQPEIVRALREAGATVQPLHAVGKGCPDLVVGYGGANFLLEVKDPGRIAKRGTVRPSDEMHAEWHTKWRGQVQIVWDAVEALQAIGVLRR